MLMLFLLVFSHYIVRVDIFGTKFRINSVPVTCVYKNGGCAARKHVKTTSTSNLKMHIYNLRIDINTFNSNISLVVIQNKKISSFVPSTFDC